MVLRYSCFSLGHSQAMTWVTHKTADGREYYHNTATNQTAWEKPIELKSDQEKALAAAATDWQEFTTSAGKKYFYNTVTKQTTWTVPDELQTAADKAACAANGGVAMLAAEREKVEREKAAAEKAAAEKAAADASSEEKRQFIEMLEGAGVSETMSWEEAMRLIINNPAYRVIKTLGERKSAFETWRDARKEAKEEAMRKDQRQKKIDFVTMLKACVELTSRTRYQRVLSLFAADPRWLALDDELEREELFEEYALSLERKEQQERRAKRKDRMAAFHELLVSSGVSAHSQWRRVQAQLDGEAAFRELDKIDRLSVFEELIRELEQRDEQDKHARKEETRRRERLQRDAFRALLLRKQREGKLTPRTRWQALLEEVIDTDEYRGAVEQARARRAAHAARTRRPLPLACLRPSASHEHCQAPPTRLLAPPAHSPGP